MSEQPNEDGLVPPFKVLRKRASGVYRADGFSGPTRRYVLIVALLVGLASLPTLAAITAGSKELDDGTPGALDAPFLPPPSTGAVIPVLPNPSAPEPPIGQTGAVRGQAAKPKTRPRPSATTGSVGRPHSDDSRYAHRNEPSTTGSDRSAPPGSASAGAPGSPSTPRPTRPPRHAQPPAKPAEPSRPPDPEDMPARHDRPFCHERAKCGSHESRHHRPDWSRHRHCEDSTHRAQWAHHREGNTRDVVVHIVPTGRHGKRFAVRQGATVSDHVIDHEGTQRHAQQMFRTIVNHRSSEDRSEPSRRSTVTERPQNVRPARGLERTHNSRHHHAEPHRDDAQAPARSYLGSHRIEHLHRADDGHRAANDRSSRVGRHHAEQTHDRTSNW